MIESTPSNVSLGFDRRSEPSLGFLKVNEQLLEVFLGMLPLLLPLPPRIHGKRYQNARDNNRELREKPFPGQ